MKRKPPSLDKPYPKHRPLSEDEAELWQETMDDGHSSFTAPPVRARAGVRGKPDTQIEETGPRLNHTPDRRERKKPENPGPIDAPSLAKVKRGRLKVQATLDLHGHTKTTAYAALVRFVENAQARGVSLILVITGKGGAGKPGILRGELPRWLEESALRERIIAYDAAAPRHGGQGAWYVRIRKRKADDAG